MITVRVKLFAAARDIFSSESLELSLDNRARVEDIFRQLCGRKPELLKWKNHLRYAVNWEYADGSASLHDNDEVAVIPPVSGG